MIVHSIARPFEAGTIEVYANEPGRCTYEWRILEETGQVIHETARVGYTSAGVALRDALDHDLAGDEARDDPPVVPISWVPGRDAASENLAQVNRSADLVRDMATDLIDEAADAQIQRGVMNADHPNGRLGMIYTDERTRVNEEVAQEMNATADRLRDMARRLTD